MNGWFCSRAFGPVPSAAIGEMRRNGSPGQVITAKKKAVPSASVIPTHGISACARWRNRYRTSAAQPVASRVQNRIDPSSAAQRLMNE